MPEDVCFNQDLAKKLPHRPLFGRKRLAAGQPLHPEDKERVFQLARHPDSFYSLVVKLQVINAIPLCTASPLPIGPVIHG